MRGPGRCPTCGGELEIRRLHCPDCQVSIEGKFSPCPFCRLDDGELHFVLTFLRTRGNIKEMERALGISYPTVRSRLGDILHLMGLGNGAQSEEEARLLKKEQRRLVLEQLERGEISAAEAAEQLHKIKSDWEESR
ncbi:MAG: DUF2089 domain-containing protein [Firmicutes bacterium]|nr:DUF2089 domain-containing protein [Bacillota bacterium]